tara:strand:+ start:263 stop:940 length:678 start_codon:yes stop_codon:yes gene_type:complete
MQISKQTLDILKNFSEVNPGILIKPGSKLETISTMKNILVKADIGENFETEFALYDLPEFLNMASGEVFLGADFTFGDSSISVTKGEAKSRYFYADPSTVTTPQKDINFPDPELTFELKQGDIETVKNMSGVLGKFDLVVRSDDTDILLSVLDKKDVGSNTFDLVVGDNVDSQEFIFYFKIENLKLIKGDYKVEISSQGISHFTHNSLPIEYWIALEPDSKYGEQ